MAIVIESLATEPTAFKRHWRAFVASKLAVLGMTLLLLVVGIAIFSPFISPQNPYDQAQVMMEDGKLEPMSKSIDGAKTYLLGTDELGRDLLSAIFYGLRISLTVGIVSTVIAMALGLFFGLIAGYKGGRVDTIIMRIVDIQLSFPAILIALILLAILGKGVEKIIIALVTVQWAYYARTVRSAALVERGKEYMEAARVMGFSQLRMVFRHLLPNVFSPLIVVATVQVAHAISLEATLSFLGLGLPPSEPSLGRLIANGFEFLMSGKYWISFYPGLALLITIVAINLVADQLRDVLNPRLSR